MSVFFVDPYKMYYDKLKPATQMTSKGKEMADAAELVKSTIERLQSQITTAVWEELGYVELVNTSIPALKSRVELLNSNVSGCLVKACNSSINEFLPLLESFKALDDEYSEIKAKSDALVEPSPTTATHYNASTKQDETVNTDAYNAYLAKKAEYEKQMSDLEAKIKPLISECDAKETEIKAINGNVQNFDTDSSGNIVEIEGLTLTETEEEMIAALQKSIEEAAIEEGTDYATKLSTLSGGNGKVEHQILGDGGKSTGYSRLIKTSHGQVVKVFQQWYNQRISYAGQEGRYLSAAGCGYNALASILSAKYPNITPEKLFVDMGKKNLFSSAIKSHLESAYGVKVGYRDSTAMRTNKKQTIINNLKKGNMVICTVEPGPDAKYTKQGHWVSLVDYDEATDSFYVTDSNDQDSSNAPPIKADVFLRNYEVNSNVIYLADASNYAAENVKSA